MIEKNTTFIIINYFLNYLPNQMPFLKQQVLFLLVAVLSVFLFFIYQDSIKALLALPESYVRM
uniref:hypothetical protein n=1 Tax=Acinetobacter stercoris TaxID=2126983 RepID=UPI001D18AFC1